MGCGQESKKKHYCEFIRSIKHDDITYSFEFQSDTLKEWKEGDHSMLIVNVDDMLTGKKLSLDSLEEEGIIRFTTRIKKEASAFKKELLELIKGEDVMLTEPAGKMTLRRENRPIVLLSNGIGIAGVRGVVKTYVKDQTGVTQMISMNVDHKSNIYKSEFDQYKKEIKDFDAYYLSHRHTLTGMLYHELKVLSKRHKEKPIVYVVGSDDFVQDQISYLKDLEFVDDDIVIGSKQTDSCCRD